ncbi:MAG TPA: non-canonical purine NTP pyrophosphatase [Flavobacteriales bacterium]|nr:non-canonical purine NTP pyrophosphatase [Flavobacteriales bacterium]|tara:strand:+ start:15451 stop:16053 length:603 start_codon:yes stop_codon:yes gene_type:complete
MERNNQQDLIFATNNENKVKEIKKLIPQNIKLLSLKRVGIEEDIPETGKTLQENALQKARYVYEKTGKDCFADDTGLQVEALNGAPGVYSARYAGEEKNADKNMDKLLSEMKGKTNRKANFTTVIALILNGKEYLFEGSVQGEIAHSKSGNEGFGYDPVFIPDEYAPKTFADIPLDEKNKISHRARAINKLVEFLKENQF